MVKPQARCIQVVFQIYLQNVFVKGCLQNPLEFLWLPAKDRANVPTHWREAVTTSARTAREPQERRSYLQLISERSLAVHPPEGGDPFLRRARAPPGGTKEMQSAGQRPWLHKVTHKHMFVNHHFLIQEVDSTRGLSFSSAASGNHLESDANFFHRVGKVSHFPELLFRARRTNPPTQ